MLSLLVNRTAAMARMQRRLCFDEHAIKIGALVRDKLPRKFERMGFRCDVRILDEAAFIKVLETKLKEGIDQLPYASDERAYLETLAMIHETTVTLTKAKGFGPDALHRVQNAKVSECGRFDSRLFLKRIWSE